MSYLTKTTEGIQRNINTSSMEEANVRTAPSDFPMDHVIWVDQGQRSYIINNNWLGE